MGDVRFHGEYEQVSFIDAIDEQDANPLGSA